jgi:hypothetical protein
MNAMKPVHLLLLAGPVVVLAGCFNSKEPLGPADHGRIDAALVGTWDCRPPEKNEDDRATLTVVEFDEHQYFAEWREPDKKPDRYRAYSTVVQGQTLLNVNDLGTHADFDWIFLRYAVADGKLTLSVVSDTALKDVTGKAALRAIAKRVKDETLYQTVAVCTAG